MLGYKIAKSGNIRVLVTLQISADALTNIERTSIVNKQTATYRTNKARVLKIEDSEGNMYNTADTGLFNGKRLIYSVGKLVEEPTYELDIEKVSTSGIHFWLDKKVAEQYRLASIENGILEWWHPNGQKQLTEMYKDGLQYGVSQYWTENGVLLSKVTYVNDVEEGPWQSWYLNGQKCSEGMMKGGKKDGVWQYWNENGEKRGFKEYINGVLIN